MAFLGNSSFIYIQHYGLTPTQYSIAFSVNAVSFFAVSQATGFLVGRFGLNRVVRIAVGGYVASMVALLAVYLARHRQRLGAGRLHVRRVRLPRPRAALDLRAGDGRAGRDRRLRLGADGHGADGRRRGGDGRSSAPSPTAPRMPMVIAFAACAVAAFVDHPADAQQGRRPAAWSKCRRSKSAPVDKRKGRGAIRAFFLSARCGAQPLGMSGQTAGTGAGT